MVCVGASPRSEAIRGGSEDNAYSPVHMVHHVFCGGSTFQVILKVHWAIWEDPIGVWVWEIWGACMAVSALGELLESVLILNWRCTVERCWDRCLFTGNGMRNVHWLVWLSCKKFWKAAVVLESF